MKNDEGLSFIRIIANWVLPSLMAALVISGFVTFEDLKVKSVSYGQTLVTLTQSIITNTEDIKDIRSQMVDVRERLVKVEK